MGNWSHLIGFSAFLLSKYEETSKIAEFSDSGHISWILESHFTWSLNIRLVLYFNLPCPTSRSPLATHTQTQCHFSHKPKMSQKSARLYTREQTPSIRPNRPTTIILSSLLPIWLRGLTIRLRSVVWGFGSGFFFVLVEIRLAIIMLSVPLNLTAFW